MCIRDRPRLPKEVVKPTIVAGVNALGRGQDREALTMFVQTIAQTLGPESLMRFINPLEAIKRLAAAQGIDVLNLVKTEQELAENKEEMMQEKQNQTLLEQAGQFANSPAADPTKQQPPIEQPE